MLRQKKKYEYIIEELLNINKENGCSVQRVDENSCVIIIPFDFESMMKYYCFNLNFTPNTPINQHISLGLVFCLIPYYKPNIKYNNDIISEEDSCLYIPYPPNKSNFIEYDKKYFISNRASIASTTYGKLIIRLINIRANPTTNQLAMLVEYEKEEYHNLSLDDIYNVYSMSSYSYEDAILEMLNRSFDNKYLNLFGIKRQYLE